MASNPQDGLPLFYNQLEALSTVTHADWKSRRVEGAPFLAKTHAVPLTVEEFAMAQRHFPIVFSVGADPVPLALMGLNEGMNAFVDDEGRLLEDVYVPAYIRRYPWMLARLTPDAQDLSLCFDPTAGAVGPYEEGEAVVVDGKASPHVQDVLKFCEDFEMAGQRTGAFMKELAENNLLMDGEFNVQPVGAEQPFTYRGFQMVSEEALQKLRGDQLRKMVQSGLLPLLYAHLFSLSLVRDVFAKQAMRPARIADADARRLRLEEEMKAQQGTAAAQ